MISLTHIYVQNILDKMYDMPNADNQSCRNLGAAPGPQELSKCNIDIEIENCAIAYSILHNPTEQGYYKLICIPAESGHWCVW